MAKYAEVINDNGTVSIDDTYARLVKTRTVSITADTIVVPESNYRDIKGYIDDKYILGSLCGQEFDLNSNEFIVAVRAKKQHANVAVMGGFTSAKKYQVSLYASLADTNTYKSDYLIDIYGTVPSSGGTNSGLEIFNTSGTKIFDSDFYTFDVSNTYSIYSSTLNPSGQVIKFGDAQTSFLIGGYSTQNHAVAINTSINKIAKHQDKQAKYQYYMAVVMYGVVFGSTIFLEKRVSPYIQFFHAEGTPHGYSHSASGLILNTKNIT